MIWEILHNQLKLVAFKEANPNIVFLEKRDVGFVKDPLGLHSKRKGAPQCGELSVDFTV